MVANFGLHNATARQWTTQEIRLVEEVADRTWAAAERSRAEAALRESEARQAFMLGLSDALRPLSDPTAIQQTACRVLGSHLGVNWAHYSEVDVERGKISNIRDFFKGDLPSHVGEYELNNYPVHLEFWAAGRSLAIDDVAKDIVLSDGERAGLSDYAVGSALTVPLLKNGTVVAVMAVLNGTPRPWSDADRSLVEETADRTWAAVERGRAERALRDSEERFKQFAEASASGLWIRDVETLAMEYTSPAIAKLYGVDQNALLGGVRRWASLVIPEDRDVALKHLEDARTGQAVVHEFRIQRPSDQQFRWIRDTDFPLRDDGHISRLGGIAEDVTETKLAVEHQRVLLHELQHRVRNIMAMIRSTAVRSADGAADVEDYKTSLAGRLLALARVQTLLTRQANAGGSLRDILESEISAQAHSENQYELTGPDIMLSPKAVEVLTLAFHELSTNALKYGALSVGRGKVTVTWTRFERREKTWIAIDWVEDGAPPRPPPTRRGFGSELIEAKIPYELRGTGNTKIEPEGARCHIEFPLLEAESILETDAPVPTRLYGGTADMTGAQDLSGKTILVVEDDYYVASDTAAALRGAGAVVLGPSPTVEDAMHLLESETPSSVVLDLNLGGGGPKFEIAHRLLRRGITFVFLTGYDPDVIPDDFAHIARLQKPIALREIVEAVNRL